MQVKSYAEHFSLENVCQNAVLHCRAHTINVFLSLLILSHVKGTPRTFLHKKQEDSTSIIINKPYLHYFQTFFL